MKSTSQWKDLISQEADEGVDNDNSSEDEREMGLQRMSTMTESNVSSARQTDKKRKFKIPRIQVPHIS